MIKIRSANKEDFEFIWPIFHSVVSKGETYVYDPDTNMEQAYTIWMERPRKTFVVELNSKIVATYYIKSNYSGLGNHICSCGYMVMEEFRNQGLAIEMCKHSINSAIQMGYEAMQFNFVVSTNNASIRLWKKMGFNIVGTIPNAYNHQIKGKVDIFIMYKSLINTIE